MENLLTEIKDFLEMMELDMETTKDKPEYEIRRGPFGSHNMIVKAYIEDLQEIVSKYE